MGAHKFGLWIPSYENYELVDSSSDCVSSLTDRNSLTDRKSTIDMVHLLENFVVSWPSCVALSATKAEYIALDSSCAHVLWITSTLQDFV